MLHKSFSVQVRHLKCRPENSLSSHFHANLNDVQARKEEGDRMRRGEPQLKLRRSLPHWVSFLSLSAGELGNTHTHSELHTHKTQGHSKRPLIASLVSQTPLYVWIYRIMADYLMSLLTMKACIEKKENLLPK